MPQGIQNNGFSPLFIIIIYFLIAKQVCVKTTEKCNLGNDVLCN